MKFFRVNSRVLLLFAGLVWITAGANVLRVGIEAWRSGGSSWPFGAAAAAAVFLLFYLFVFKRLYFRHANRIESKEGRSCPFSFFDIKGWIVMGAMIAFGAAARSFGLFSDSFVSVFYIGLSSALIVTGIRFLYRWKRFRRRSFSVSDWKNSITVYCILTPPLLHCTPYPAQAAQKRHSHRRAAFSYRIRRITPYKAQ